MNNDANEYYKSYYDKMGEISYVGQAWQETSRFLVFKDWLRATLKPGDKILDIGCGDATFARQMPEFEWYGVDINLEKAKDIIKPNQLREADLMQPPYPFEKGEFDAIVCSEVLEHLWDLRIVHQEARRLLKRDGIYFLSTPNFDWIANHLEHYRRIMQDRTNHWAWEHVRHYNLETHTKFLNDSGFIVDKFTGADGHFCPIMANVCLAIRDSLREQGVEIPIDKLHQWGGRGLPHYQHTVCVASKKA